MSTEFLIQLDAVTDKAAYLEHLDVVDVNFTSGHGLEVFVASTDIQRSRGLGDLEEIPTQGMLFFYSTATYKPFTMKDMAFDLDFGWYDSEGKLLDIQQHKAGSTAPVVTANKYNYVIEAVSGMLPLADIEIS